MVPALNTIIFLSVYFCGLHKTGNSFSRNAAETWWTFLIHPAFFWKVITIVCIAVWAINIGHFNDPAHGGSWLKVLNADLFLISIRDVVESEKHASCGILHLRLTWIWCIHSCLPLLILQ